MLAWSKAFSSALKVIVYSFGFWILGVALIVFGFSQITPLIYSTTDRYYLNVGIGALSILCGAIIASLGGFASFLKVLTDLIVGETIYRSNINTDNNMCTICGNKNPPTAIYCQSCGKKLNN